MSVQRCYKIVSKNQPAYKTRHEKIAKINRINIQKRQNESKAQLKLNKSLALYKQTKHADKTTQPENDNTLHSQRIPDNQNSVIAKLSRVWPEETETTGKKHLKTLPNKITIDNGSSWHITYNNGRFAIRNGQTSSLIF